MSRQASSHRTSGSSAPETVDGAIVYMFFSGVPRQRQVLVVFVYCKDVGFKCCSRKRGWHIAVDKRWGEFVRDPNEVYKMLRAPFKDIEPFTADQVFCLDSLPNAAEEFQREKKLAKKQSKKGCSLLPGAIGLVMFTV